MGGRDKLVVLFRNQLELGIVGRILLLEQRVVENLDGGAGYGMDVIPGLAHRNGVDAVLSRAVKGKVLKPSVSEIQDSVEFFQVVCPVVFASCERKHRHSCRNYVFYDIFHRLKIM